MTSSHSESSRRQSWIWVWLLGAIGVHAWLVSRGWAFFGGYEFRQAQTALTAWWMKREGFRLAYSTPLLGPPWSIPMEFPLYQWLVAKLSNLTGLNVTESGRWVGMMMFYATVPGAWLVLRRCRLTPGQGVCTLLPVLGAPLYLFYARDVLIETTALFGSVWFLACSLGYLQEGGGRWLAGVWLAGAWAALAKVTTWAAFLTPVALAGLAMIWQAEAGRRWHEFRRVAARLLLALVPLFLVAWWWVWEADQIKARNPNAAFLLSSNLNGFNFGEIGLRFTADYWRVMGARAAQQLVPAWCGAALLVALVLIRARWRWLAAGAVLSFLATPLVFANLHHVHEYYTCANGIFLCLAAGLVVAGLVEQAGWRRWAGLGLLAGLLGAQFFAYRQYDLPRQMIAHPADPAFTQAMRELSGPDDVFVAVGNDWHGAMALQTQRRAWMIPTWMADRDPAIMAPGVAQLQGKHVAFVVFTGARRERWDWIDACIANFSLNPDPLFTDAGNQLTVYAAADEYERYLRELTARHPDGLTITGHSDADTRAQARPVDAAALGDLAPHFSPLPYQGIFLFGINRLLQHGEPQLVAPDALYFKRPAGATTVEATFSISAEVFAKPAFDGIQFRIEYRFADGRVQVLFHQWLQPQLKESDRASRTVTVTLPASPDGEVVLRALPGPAGNRVFDWGMWESVRIR